MNHYFCVTPMLTVSRYCLLYASLQGFLNVSVRERFPDSYKKCFVLLPTDVGSQIHPPSGPSILAGTPNSPRSRPNVLAGTSPMSTSFRAQPPLWHIAQFLALIPFVTAQTDR